MLDTIKSNPYPLVYSLFGLLCIWALVFTGISSLLYIVIAGYLIRYLQKKQIMNKINDEDRVRWLLTIIQNIDPTIRYNTAIINDYSVDRRIFTNLQRKSKLGITEFNIGHSTIMPDLNQVELEMTKLEERASIMLGTLVFIPIMFVLLHLFRQVHISIFVLELVIALVLSFIIIQSQYRIYDLAGWKEVYTYLEEKRFDLIINPRLTVRKDALTKVWFLPEELAIRSTDIILPSYKFLYVVLKLLIELKEDQRDEYLSRIISEIKDLPGRELVIEQKWQAYKMRLFLISGSSTALGAMFSSLTNLNIPVLENTGYVFETTAYLVWGEFFLLISLNYLVFNQWFNRRKIIQYLIIQSLIFWGFYLINNSILS